MYSFLTMTGFNEASPKGRSYEDCGEVLEMTTAQAERCFGAFSSSF